MVSHSGLRTGLFGPSTPAFSARSSTTNLKSRPPLGRKSLVLACGQTYQTVSKKGTLLVEEYFYGFDRTRKHQLQSVTKSVASILTGIALQQGLLSSVDESVASFYPELAAEQDWDDRKRRMTIKHLLTMTSGFEGNAWRDKNATASAMYASPDWIKFAVSRSVVAEPGRRFAYNGACLMVLSGILERASEMPVQDFAAQYLFTPLGIEDVTWRKSPSGSAYLGAGLWLKPRDLAKIGQLFLNKGHWQNQLPNHG